MELETANAEAPASVSETPVPASVPETPAVAESPAAVREKQDAALTETMMKVWEKNNPPRSEDGKFASRNPEAPAQAEATGTENTEGQTPEAPAVETAKPSIDPPASWSREVRDQWATLPPAVQEYIAKREGEAHSQITRLGETARKAEPLLSVIEQNRELFARRNVQPDQGVQALLNAQRKLDENPVAAIGWLAQQYGVDLSMFANPDGSQSANSPLVASLQAELQSIRRELAETKGTVQSRIEAETQAKYSQIESLAAQFFRENELTDADEPQLAEIARIEREMSPDKSPEQILKDALEIYRLRNPEHRAKLLEKELAEQRAKEAKEAEKKAAEAKKLSSMNVRSSPAGKANAKSWDEDLAAAYWAAQKR